MNAARVLFVLLLMAACACAQQLSVTELQHRADLARGGECVKDGLQAARATLNEANALFTAGNNSSGHTDVGTAVRYVRRAVDCSVQSHKGAKQAEIALRQLIRHAHDIAQSVDFEDRQQIAPSLVELDRQRDRLLHEIFGDALGGRAERKP
jgi:hypothetical protein